jgi:hypothetical protein
VCNRKNVSAEEASGATTPKKETADSYVDKSPQRARSTSVDRLKTIEDNRLRIKSDAEEKAALECIEQVSAPLLPCAMSFVTWPISLLSPDVTCACSTWSYSA